MKNDEFFRFQSMPFFQCHKNTNEFQKRSDKRLSSVKNNERIAGDLASNVSLSRTRLFEYLGIFLDFFSYFCMDKYKYFALVFFNNILHLVLFDRFRETKCTC